MLNVINRVCQILKDAGGRPFIVGGYVRDKFLGLPSKDCDIEVFGLTYKQISKALRKNMFDINMVGKDFGVLSICNYPIDISVPRKERKIGPLHTDYDIYTNPKMSFEDALRRRDLTINSILYDPIENKIIDPFGGVIDIKNKIIRHTSERFVEDPLRVLRIMQFAARFDFDVSKETIELCSTLYISHIKRERVFSEWQKLILKGIKPSKGLKFLRDCGWIKYFPELEDLIGCQQNPKWHPEGDVWNHTLLCMDHFAENKIDDPYENLVVGLGVLCHDFGKPSVTMLEDGVYKSKGHAKTGKEPTISFMARMTNQSQLIDDIVSLVRNHIVDDNILEAKDSTVLRLSHRVGGRIDRLMRVFYSDKAGRYDDRHLEVEDIFERAKQLEVDRNKPKPILMGRHLLELGFLPGENIGQVLKYCFEKQLDGDLKTIEDCKELVREILGEL